MGKFYWLKQVGARVQQQPALISMGVIWLVYVWYLPTTTYEGLYHDAHNYWDFAEDYFKTGRFTFPSYFNLKRGYFFPLLLSPFTQLVASQHLLPLAITRCMGAVLAAVVFGWAGPALWQAVKGDRPASVARRLLFAAVGFVLWRDHFNFSMTDFPALLALATSLVCLLRGRGLWSGVLAGMALAAAANMRPVYQVSMPFVGLLALLPPEGRTRWWGWARSAALGLGVAILLMPQAYINYSHFGIPTPFVMTTVPGQPTLYVQQLQWGLTNQKYETNIGKDYPYTGMTVVDKRGKTMWESTGLSEFTAASQYLKLCLGRPWRILGVWERHLFNGLDVQYPTPYVQAVFVSTWPLAWLNYSLIFGGLVVLLAWSWQRPAQGWLRPLLVLLTLLVPCLLTLPTAMEPRFLLPLHLLLSAAVAFGAAPIRWWRAATIWARGLMVVSYVSAIMLGFLASDSAQKHLYEVPRHIIDDLPFHFLHSVNGEPW